MVDSKCQNTAIFTRLTYTFIPGKRFLINDQQWSKIIDWGSTFGRKNERIIDTESGRRVPTLLEGLFEFFSDIYNIFPEGVFSFKLNSIQGM